MDPVTILAALAPVVVDGLKGVVNRWIAPDTFRPTNVDDYVKMRTLDVQLFTSLAEAGGNEPTYPWVNAVKQLQRPFIAGLALSVWGYAHIGGAVIDPVSMSAIDNFAAAVGFYLFGDRTLFYVKRQK